MRKPSPTALATSSLLLAFAAGFAITTTAEPVAPVERQQRGPLVLEGIPEIPQRIHDRLLRYQSIRSARFQGWLPDGAGILISTRFGDTDQLHLVREPGGARRQLTFFDEPVRNAEPSPAGSAAGFVFPHDVGGSENYRLFFFDLASGDTRPISEGASRNGSPSWSPDGRVAFYSTARNGRDWDILVGTPDGAPPRRVLEVSGAWVPGAWSPDGEKLVVTRLVSVRENHPHLLTLASGELVPLAAGEGASVADGFAFSPDGAALYFISDHAGELRRLYRRDLESGVIASLTDDLGWDVEDLALSPDGQHLVFSINDGGRGRLQLRHVPTWSERPLPDLPAGRVRDLEWSPDGSHLGFSLEAPRLAGDAFAIALESGELVRWTSSETAGLPEDQLIEPSLVHYPTFDQVDGAARRIPAFYYRPAGPGPFPVVIDIHGGPEGQSRAGFERTIQYWARELGIAVLLPNVRGSKGYGKSYLQLDNGFAREDSVRDIGSLLDWIEGRPELDGDRVAVYGGSYGGYMVLASMVHFNDRLRAGVDLVGISNFVSFLTNTKDYRRDLRRVEYGDERDPAMRAHLEKISPTAHAAEIQKPLFIAQGLNDPRVPASESEQMVREIRDNGGLVWYLLANDEGHGFSKKTNRDFFEAAVIRFFESYLLPTGEAPPSE